MRQLALACFALLATAAFVRCGPTGPTGGPVMGAVDMHCIDVDGGAIVQETSMAACHPPDAGDEMGTDFGATLYNSAGSDDDCKYDVSWTSTPIRENTDVTFTFVVKSRVDSSVVSGGGPYAEVFIGNTPAPNSGQATTEPSPGTYAIGPVLFNASGDWTVRLHIFGDCSDALDTSPHGHAAFFVHVP